MTTSSKLDAVVISRGDAGACLRVHSSSYLILGLTARLIIEPLLSTSSKVGAVVISRGDAGNKAAVLLTLRVVFRWS